jgi:hypothetical protein
VELKARHFHYVEMGRSNIISDPKCKTRHHQGGAQFAPDLLAGESTLEVKYRELSCFCHACMDLKWEECEDLATVGSMRNSKVKTRERGNRTSSPMGTSMRSTIWSMTKGTWAIV